MATATTLYPLNSISFFCLAFVLQISSTLASVPARWGSCQKYLFQSFDDKMMSWSKSQAANSGLLGWPLNDEQYIRNVAWVKWVSGGKIFTFLPQPSLWWSNGRSMMVYTVGIIQKRQIDKFSAKLATSSPASTKLYEYSYDMPFMPSISTNVMKVELTGRNWCIQLDWFSENFENLDSRIEPKSWACPLSERSLQYHHPQVSSERTETWQTYPATTRFLIHPFVKRRKALGWTQA